ncbi:Uncharacterised protein g4668 [Pycnogonum litorale]
MRESIETFKASPWFKEPTKVVRTFIAIRKKEEWCMICDYEFDDVKSLQKHFYSKHLTSLRVACEKSSSIDFENQNRNYYHQTGGDSKERVTNSIPVHQQRVENGNHQNEWTRENIPSDLNDASATSSSSVDITDRNRDDSRDDCAISSSTDGIENINTNDLKEGVTDSNVVVHQQDGHEEQKNEQVRDNIPPVSDGTASMPQENIVGDVKDEQEYQCGVCLLYLTSESALSRHVKSHLRKKKSSKSADFKCERCKRRFKSKAWCGKHAMTCSTSKRDI